MASPRPQQWTNPGVAGLVMPRTVVNVVKPEGASVPRSRVGGVSEQQPPEPVLRIEKGDPTDEELAALIAAVSAKIEASRAVPERRPSNWAAYWRSVGAPPSPGPSAWRQSTLPR
jgi:Acyl-CoA carboxylase epsilon subunit